MTIDQAAITEAKALADQHVAGHDRPRDQYLPECVGCHQYMETGPDWEPSAFCDACAFKALDTLAPLFVAVLAERNEALREISRMTMRPAAEVIEYERARLARFDQAVADRDAARAELERWRNCGICPQCGRGAFDEDGCCATCGRDVLGFTDGKLVRPLEDVPDPLVAEARTAKAIAQWMLDIRFIKAGREAEWTRHLAARIEAHEWRPR